MTDNAPNPGDAVTVVYQNTIIKENGPKTETKSVSGTVQGEADGCVIVDSDDSDGIIEVWNDDSVTYRSEDTDRYEIGENGSIVN